MNYKQALKLKKDGFSQDVDFELGGSFYIKEDPTLSDEIFFIEYKNRESMALWELVKIPTLEELIKECGEEGREIELSEHQEWWGHETDEKTHLLKKDKQGKYIKKLLKEYHWVAKLVDWDSKEYGKKRCYEDGDEVVERAEGKYLLEAVAKLWLKLNEK